MKTKEFFGANMLQASISDTGSRGGDSGHGGRVFLQFVDLGGTDMHASFYMDRGAKVIELEFLGDSERKTLIHALEFFLTELKSKP
jgi:hypothetical protein